MEAAKKNVAETHASEPRVSDVHKVKAVAEANVTRRDCYRCGSAKHGSRVCPHIADICFKCDKKGHVQRVCHADKEKKSKCTPRKAMKKLVPVQDPVGMKEMTTSGMEPIKLTINVQEVALEMELDTKATVSVMSLQQFRQISPSTKIMPTTLKLRTFKGDIVQPVGVAHVDVQYGQQRTELPLYITREKGPHLLGPAVAASDPIGLEPDLRDQQHCQVRCFGAFRTTHKA
ncbi:uncharacterized protein LOC121835046 [Ixodes scapularis]|uniref:uncharacterized protein LOC121835046 n=1 Tax=Ixodes scapularis TaxID=6945 RepID=UPI001C389FC4|nr:uncharacterized protein LOC121835046 [Ixodes scapularis]